MKRALISVWYKKDIVELSSVSYTVQDSLLSETLVQDAKDSVAFTNVNPATGGSNGQTIREVRESALAYFLSQQRSVTKEDYIVRAYSLPPKYGNLAKVHFVQDDLLSKYYKKSIFNTDKVLLYKYIKS